MLYCLLVTVICWMTVPVGANNSTNQIGITTGCDLYDDEYCIKIDEYITDLYDDMDTQQTFDYLISQGTQYKAAAEILASDLTSGNLDDSDYVGISIENGTAFEGAFAIGVFLTGISNIDYLNGKYDASMRLYIFNITNPVFDTAKDSTKMIYKNTTRIERMVQFSNNGNVDHYYTLLDEEIPLEGHPHEPFGNIVGPHPDGYCSPLALSALAPLDYESAEDMVNSDWIRMEHQARLTKLAPVYDPKKTFLDYIEINAPGLSFRPFNQQFYPFEVDMLDIHFYFASSGQVYNSKAKTGRTTTCFHPQYTGFSSFIFGVNDNHQSSSFNYLTMMPHLSFHQSPPWILSDYRQLHFGDTDEYFWAGDHIEPTPGIRLMYVQPKASKFFAIFPYLFVSFSTQLQWMTLEYSEVTPGDMISALLLVQGLVTSGRTVSNRKNLAAQTAYLAYGITGIYIFTVAVMTGLNKMKKVQEKKRYLLEHQQRLFEYLRAFSLLLTVFYIPILTISTDKTNGYQKQYTSLWILAVCLLGVVLGYMIIKDVLACCKARKDPPLKEEDDNDWYETLDQWDELKVVRWIIEGRMKNEIHFSKDCRHDIAEKFTSARLNGKALNEFSADIDTLIKYTSLSYGDAHAISKEVQNLHQLHNTKEVIEKGVPPSNIGVTHPISYEDTDRHPSEDRRNSATW